MVGRILVLLSAFGLVACETAPPLLKEDGQYKASRDERAQERQMAKNAERLRAEEALRRAAAESNGSVMADLPAEPGIPESDLPSALIAAAAMPEPGSTAPDVDAILMDLDQEAAVRLPRSQPVPLQFPSTDETPKIEPVASSRPKTIGPYFETSAPTSLPPVKQANPAPRQRPVAIPQIVGTAAPDATSKTAPPTVYRAPVNANGNPAPLNREFNKVPQAQPAPAPAPVAAGPAIDGAAHALQQSAASQALARVNAYRAQVGAKPLILNDALSAVARAHVADLARRGVVSSKNAAGQAVGTRLGASGYRSSVAGSVVAGGYSTFEDAFLSWTKDNVEASRLLLPSATEMGFAIITDQGSTYRTYIETIVAAP